MREESEFAQREKERKRETERHREEILFKLTLALRSLNVLSQSRRRTPPPVAPVLSGSWPRSMLSCEGDERGQVLMVAKWLTACIAYVNSHSKTLPSHIRS